MPLADLLQWLDQACKTGTLQVQGQRFTKTIVTRAGRIIASASSDPNDYLGHFLLRKGLITEAQLKMGMETQRQTKAMLGKILVTVGVLTESQLQEVLVQKAEETVFSIFLWREGRFVFRDGVVPERVTVPLDLKVGDVLLKGLTWYDELQHIRGVFKSSQSLLTRTEKPLPDEVDPQNSFTRRVVALLDGRHSIVDICLAVHASEFAVGRLLYELHKQGCIGVSERREEKHVPPRKTFSGLLDEARSLMRAGEAEAALKVIEEARPLCSHDADLLALNEEARAAFVHQAYRDGLRPEAIPSLSKPLESLTSEKLTPEQMFLLTRINGSWDIRSIISVSPFPEPDVLLQMKKLKDRGLLALEVPA